MQLGVLYIVNIQLYGVNRVYINCIQQGVY